MVSQRSKRELAEAVRPRYLKANQAGKGKILDEFVAATVIIANMPIEFLGKVALPKG